MFHQLERPKRHDALIVAGQTRNMSVSDSFPSKPAKVVPKIQQLGDWCIRTLNSLHYPVPHPTVLAASNNPYSIYSRSFFNLKYNAVRMRIDRHYKNYMDFDEVASATKMEIAKSESTNGPNRQNIAFTVTLGLLSTKKDTESGVALICNFDRFFIRLAVMIFCEEMSGRSASIWVPSMDSLDFKISENGTSIHRFPSRFCRRRHEIFRNDGAADVRREMRCLQNLVYVLLFIITGALFCLLRYWCECW